MKIRLGITLPGEGGYFLGGRVLKKWGLGNSPISEGVPEKVDDYFKGGSNSCL